MRSTIKFVLAGLAIATSGWVLAAKPGKVWEMKMELPGMPMAMPAQQVCVPDGTPAGSAPSDPKCQILDQKQSGNRVQWKAKCPDGLMEADFTSSPAYFRFQGKPALYWFNPPSLGDVGACQSPY